VGVTGLGENCGRHRLGRLVGARVGFSLNFVYSIKLWAPQA